MDSGEELLSQAEPKPDIFILQRIIERIGFTRIHFLLFISGGLICFNEGAEMISFNMLIPSMKEIFTNSKPILLSFISSIFFIGYLIGTLFVGVITKYIGRRLCLIVSLNLLAFFGTIIAIWENLYSILFCRLAVGMLIGIVTPQMLSNLFEFLPQTGKELALFAPGIFYRLGVIYFLFSYRTIIPVTDITHWRFAFVVAIFPIIITIIFGVLFYYDSPRLLLNKNMITEAVEQLIKLSSYTNTGITSDEIQRLHEEGRYLSSTPVDFSYMLLFDSQYIKLTLLCSLVFFFGSSISVTNLYCLPIILYDLQVTLPSIDSGMNMIITQVVTIPAIILGAFSCKYLGRKYTMVFGFSSCLIITFYPMIFKDGLVPSSAIINFFVMFAIVPGKLYVMEAFPTKLRDISLAFLFGVCKVGDSLTPFISDVSMKTYIFGPMIQISILSLGGLLAAYFLPQDANGKDIL